MEATTDVQQVQTHTHSSSQPKRKNLHRNISLILLAIQTGIATNNSILKLTPPLSIFNTFIVILDPSWLLFISIFLPLLFIISFTAILAGDSRWPFSTLLITNIFLFVMSVITLHFYMAGFLLTCSWAYRNAMKVADMRITLRYCMERPNEKKMGLNKILLLLLTALFLSGMTISPIYLKYSSAMKDSSVQKSIATFNAMTDFFRKVSYHTSTTVTFMDHYYKKLLGKNEEPEQQEAKKESTFEEFTGYISKEAEAYIKELKSIFVKENKVPIYQQKETE